MKVMMTAFGALDIILVLSHLPHLPGYLRGIAQLQVVPAICVVLLITFAMTAYSFIAKRSWVFPLSYVQFPFRIGLSFMSLGFVAQILLPPNPSAVFNEAVWMSCAATEGIRLGLTIMLHREMRKSPNNVLERTR
jgi:hypothetical protein